MSGRFGIVSQLGRGIRVGVLVPLDGGQFSPWKKGTVSTYGKEEGDQDEWHTNHVNTNVHLVVVVSTVL